MRLFTGGLITETSSFSPLPTGLRSFALGDETCSLTMRVAERCTAEGWTHLRGLVASAHPGAPAPTFVYEALRDRILADLAAALPIDIALFELHGGMVAQGYDDPEGDLLTRARALCGPATIIGARLDPHAHLSPAMLDPADLLCFYKENPHTDIDARGADLLRLAIEAAAGRIKPVMSPFDCRMADVFQTNREPMRSLVERLRALEGTDDILDISIVHGFRRADVPLMGAHIIVITNNQPQAGAALAERLGHELFAMRGAAAQPYVPLAEAIQTAAARAGPTLLADIADNPGGGSPGDSTSIVRAALAAGIRRIALGYLVDPPALAIAREAGVGARRTMRLGGKACRLSGEPLDLDIEVMGVIDDARLAAVDARMGPAAHVRAGDLDIVLIGERIQTFTPELFRAFRIALENKQVIIVKSAQHYRAFFDAALTANDIVVDAPGVCTADWRHLPFTRVRRDIWPFTDDPWQGQGGRIV